jgi:hypothetical protein
MRENISNCDVAINKDEFNEKEIFCSHSCGVGHR